MNKNNQPEELKLEVFPFGNSQLLSILNGNCNITKIFGPPGTGKTSKLMEFVKKKVEAGVNTEEIAFISFTNAAADEAKSRISKDFPDRGSIDFPNFSTLHSLATRLNGALGRTLCQEEHFKEFDPSIVCEIEWIRQGDPTSAVVRPKHPVLDSYFLSLARCEPFKPGRNYDDKATDALVGYFKKPFNEIRDYFNKYCIEYILKYLDFKKSNHLADFNDVIINVCHPDFYERLPNLNLLIIDEAQDLSELQWIFVRRLISKASETIVAGDDDQAIMIGFGASAHAFLELPGIELQLPQSFRIPKEVSDYVELGVMKLLQENNRKEKSWSSASHSGKLITQYERCEVENSEQVIRKSDFTPSDLIEEIIKSPHEEWLILAPTRKTGADFSTGLELRGIPHFYRNIPKCGANERTNINIKSIHTAKGLGADNVAIVVMSFGDVAMLTHEPRLAYVALTRAKKMLLPRVIKRNLLPDMFTSRKGPWSSMAHKYTTMFPI